MVTRLGTRLGTTLGTDLGSFTDTPPVVYPTINALLPLHRYRVSQAATSGGNVTNVPNEGSAGGQLNMAAGTLTPTAVTALKSQPGVVFSGTQELQSSLAAAAWTFMSNGSDFTAYSVSLTMSAMLRTYAAATSGFPGAAMVVSSSQVNISVSDGDGVPFPVNLTASGANTGLGIIGRYGVTAGQGFVYRNGALGAGPTTAPTPFVTTTPQFTASVGRVPGGGAFVTGTLCELIAFNRVLTASEIAAVDAELFATYGVHA
jgi:hypothetical protein